MCSSANPSDKKDLVFKKTLKKIIVDIAKKYLNLTIFRKINVINIKKVNTIVIGIKYALTERSSIKLKKNKMRFFSTFFSL
tara:strand:+ start:745 stop:987 length:243 start_codon:yes stop_codon:yes gene_type:complete